MAQPRLRRLASRETIEAAPPPTTRRNSNAVKAARAATLLDSQHMRDVFEACRQNCIRDIESATLDGSQASELRVVELVRQLQSLLTVKRTILQPLVAEQMKKST